MKISTSQGSKKIRFLYVSDVMWYFKNLFFLSRQPSSTFNSSPVQSCTLLFMYPCTGRNFVIAWLILSLSDCRLEHRRAAQAQVQPEEAQAQPEAEDPLHHPTAVEPGEEVPREAVPEHRRESGVQQLPTSHRDPGENILQLSRVYNLLRCWERLYRDYQKSSPSDYLYWKILGYNKLFFEDNKTSKGELKRVFTSVIKKFLSSDLWKSSAIIYCEGQL